MIEKEFKEWLNKKQYMPTEVIKILEALKVSSDYVRLYCNKNLWEIQNSEDIVEVIKELKAQTGFKVINFLKKDLYIKSLKYYRDYLCEVSNSKTIPIYPEVEKASNEITNLFNEEKFQDFVVALQRKGIINLKQLKKINVYKFLNDNNISYGSDRYELLNDIVTVLNASLEEVFAEESSLKNNINNVFDALDINEIDKITDEPPSSLKEEPKNEYENLDDIQETSEEDTYTEKKDKDSEIYTRLEEKEKSEEFNSSEVGNDITPKVAIEQPVDKTISEEVQIEEYLKAQGLRGIKPNQIINDLGLGKKFGIRKIVNNANWCVEISKEKFIHKESITDLYDAAEIILKALKNMFARNDGYVSSKQLFDAVRTSLDIFMFDNDFDSKDRIYYVAKHLFSKENYKEENYIFYDNFHIWETEPNYPKNLTGLLINYARNKGGVVEKEECEEYLKSLGVATINVPSKMKLWHESIFWQIDGEKFLLSEFIKIDEDFIESLRNNLNSLLQNNNYVIIDDIVDHWYGMLPLLPQNIGWTPLLLQEAIKNLETGFKTIPTGPGESIDTVHVAITKEGAAFNTFADLVWDYINSNMGTPVKMEYEELRNKLTEAGLLRHNQRIKSMHKVLEDYRFIWLDDNKSVNVTRG